jgi:hypothetical protein
MKTELKIAIFSLLAAIIGSSIGALTTLKVTKQETGSNWDLRRTESVLKAARLDYKAGDTTGYAAWVCYHSILWDCANQEWSITNESIQKLALHCPPDEPINYEKHCHLRDPIKK